ncbi:unnamed protein product [Calypogeia fissa]
MNRAVSLRADINGRSDGTGFRRWVVAFCCIRFDLEQGQVVEECFPTGAISPEEELDVAFSSFPDSMSQADNRASIHDCFFFFRIRRRGVVVSPYSQSTMRRTTSLLNYERHGGVSPGGSPAKDGSELPSRSREGSPASEHGQVLASQADSSQVNSPGDQRSSGGASADEVATPPRTDVESQCGEGAWGNVPVPSLIASVLSPRLRPRDASNESPAEGQASKVGNGSTQPSHPAVKDRGNGGFGNYGNFHGISASGAPRYLYGFVFNRQRQDERLKRGGEQKSLVVLSERPFLCVFKPLVQILGPLYFDIGSKALEQVASEVSLWPAPLHGQQMELPVANSTIRTHLPPAHTLPPGSGNPLDEFTCAIAPAAPVTRSVPLGIFHQADLFGMFRGVLMQLWVLWELLLVGEPLLVVAPTPSQCCEAVAALVGLVAPLPCSVDFRPYFTIHDPDFAALNALKEGEPVPPMVLGVTNPFFLKALRNFSNVISVGSVQPSSNRFKAARASPQNGIKTSEGRLQLQIQISPLKRFSPTNLLKVARVKKDGPSSLMSEHKEALWTNFVTCTKPDTNVLNRLVDAEVTTPRTEESVTLVNNDILQRHFTELTTNFLSPFGPYLRASAPQEGASPFADPPPLPSFNVQEFLEGLAARGSGKFLAKRLRGNWLELYRRFLKGPNFMPWFQRRRSVAEQEQHRIWRQARSKADVRGFLAKMSEVEIIDAFSAIERHLVNELQIVQRAGLGNSEGPICQKLRSDLRAIFNVLPKDMQQMLLFNPTRASLLQGGRELTKHPGRASFSFRNPEDITRKAESFRTRNSSSSPEMIGRKSAESPALTSRISPLAVKRAATSRAEELAQDPLHL